MRKFVKPVRKARIRPVLGRTQFFRFIWTTHHSAKNSMPKTSGFVCVRLYRRSNRKAWRHSSFRFLESRLDVATRLPGAVSPPAGLLGPKKRESTTHRDGPQ